MHARCGVVRLGAAASVRIGLLALLAAVPVRQVVLSTSTHCRLSHLQFVALLSHWTRPSAGARARATARRRLRRARPVYQARSAPASHGGPDELAGMRGGAQVGGKSTFQRVANTAIGQLGPCSDLSPGF
jgi:hypothetical protein